MRALRSRSDDSASAARGFGGARTPRPPPIRPSSGKATALEARALPHCTRRTWKQHPTPSPVMTRPASSCAYECAVAMSRLPARHTAHAAPALGLRPNTSARRPEISPPGPETKLSTPTSSSTCEPAAPVARRRWSEAAVWSAMARSACGLAGFRRGGGAVLRVPRARRGQTPEQSAAWRPT